MSTWTHANGSIRIDSIRGLGMPFPNKDSIAKDLGVIVEYEDMGTPTTVPCGSEGSLVYSIWDNPDFSSTASYVVNIFGDLRDFDEDDCPRILSWIDAFTTGKMVRQGFMQIETEGRDPVVCVYDCEKEEWDIR